MRRIILSALSALLLSAILAGGTHAQAENPPSPSDDQVNAVARNLYCPVCPNTPLDVCETQACKDWRAQIRDQLAAGWNEKQIMDYFVTQYGERVLAEPRRSGFTSLVWVLPVIAVSVGLGFTWQVLKRWQSHEPAAAASSPVQSTVPQELLAEIERELRGLD